MKQSKMAQMVREFLIGELKTATMRSNAYNHVNNAINRELCARPGGFDLANVTVEPGDIKQIVDEVIKDVCSRI